MQFAGKRAEPSVRAPQNAGAVRLPVRRARVPCAQPPSNNVGEDPKHVREDRKPHPLRVHLRGISKQSPRHQTNPARNPVASVLRVSPWSPPLSSARRRTPQPLRVYRPAGRALPRVQSPGKSRENQKKTRSVGFEVIGVSFVPLSVPPCAPSGQLHAELWTALGDRIVRLNRKRRWGYVGSRRFPSERGGIIKKGRKQRWDNSVPGGIIRKRGGIIEKS